MRITLLDRFATHHRPELRQDERCYSFNVDLLADSFVYGEGGDHDRGFCAMCHRVNLGRKVVECTLGLDARQQRDELLGKRVLCVVSVMAPS